MRCSKTRKKHLRQNTQSLGDTLSVRLNETEEQLNSIEEQHKHETQPLSIRPLFLQCARCFCTNAAQFPAPQFSVRCVVLHVNLNLNLIFRGLGFGV